MGEHILIEHVHKDLLGWQEVDNEDLDGYFIDQGTRFYVVSTLPDQYMIRWLSKQKDVSGLEVPDGCIHFVGRVGYGRECTRLYRGLLYYSYIQEANRRNKCTGGV